MKHIAFQIFLFISAACLIFAANPSDATPAVPAPDSEQLVIAEVHNGTLVPMLTDRELKDLLEDAFNTSRDRNQHVWFEKVWFEKHDESHYLMSVAKDSEGGAFSSGIKLEEVDITTHASAVGIPVPIAVFPYCKSITCTNDPCPMRVYEDHIDCYCIAAGDCKLKWRIIFVEAGSASGL